MQFGPNLTVFCGQRLLQLRLSKKFEAFEALLMGPQRTVGMGFTGPTNGTERNGVGFKRARRKEGGCRAGTEKEEGREHVSTWHCVPALPLPPLYHPSNLNHSSDRFEAAAARARNPSRPYRRERRGGASSMPRQDVPLPYAFTLVLGKGWVLFGWVLPFFLPVIP